MDHQGCSGEKLRTLVILFYLVFLAESSMLLIVAYLLV